MAGSGAATPAVGAPTASSAPAAAAPSEPAPNLLRGKTLEDIVDTWSKDLDAQTKEFERQAGEVREWDKVLVRNGNQVS
jgi:nuclear pore complex protein Nup62